MNPSNLNGMRYDPVLFRSAHTKYLDSPRDLSDDELAQLEYVNEQLGTRARAKRQGIPEPEDPDPLLKQKVTVGLFLNFLRDSVFPQIATYRVRGQEDRVRLHELERRLTELESRPEIKYCGAHVGGAQYTEGNLTTRSGALWLATRVTSGTPGQPASGWRLIVKSREG